MEDKPGCLQKRRHAPPSLEPEFLTKESTPFTVCHTDPYRQTNRQSSQAFLTSKKASTSTECVLLEGHTSTCSKHGERTDPSLIFAVTGFQGGSEGLAGGNHRPLGKAVRQARASLEATAKGFRARSQLSFTNSFAP